MNILALDLGTHTGWAQCRDGQPSSGTWLLATEKELREQRKAGLARCCDCRFDRLRQHILIQFPVDIIAFEDVQFLSSQAQSQLWAGFRTVVTLFHRPARLLAVPVGRLKKFATGNGNAKKEDMGAAWRNTHGLLSTEGRDDNEIDALHLLEYAKLHHSEAK